MFLKQLKLEKHNNIRLEILRNQGAFDKKTVNSQRKRLLLHILRKKYIL